MARTRPEDIAPLWRRACEAAIAFRHDVRDRAAAPQDDYAASLRGFSAPLPETGSDPEAVLGDLVRLADPGLMTPTGPRFFGWVIGGSHPAGVAADWLTSAWGQNAGNHEASPAASAAETVAAGWLLEPARPAPRGVARVRHRRDDGELHRARRRPQRGAA